MCIGIHVPSTSQFGLNVFTDVSRMNSYLEKRIKV